MKQESIKESFDRLRAKMESEKMEKLKLSNPLFANWLNSKGIKALEATNLDLINFLAEKN